MEGTLTKDIKEEMNFLLEVLICILVSLKRKLKLKLIQKIDKRLSLI